VGRDMAERAAAGENDFFHNATSFQWLIRMVYTG